jgi:hypothetical protein
MATALGHPTNFNTRRAPRYRASLPVLITRCDGVGLPVPGLTSEISQTGMAVFGGVNLENGDLMEIEFQTEGRFRVEGIVRNRSGFCFGLEFLNVLPSREEDEEKVLYTPAIFVEPEPVVPAETPTLEGVVQVAEQQMKDTLLNWVSDHRGDVLIVLSCVLLFAAMFVGSSVHSASSKPTLSLWQRTLISLDLAEAPPPPVVAGNPNAQVWVDVHTALYYCSGADLFGKTEGGRITTQRDARLDAFEPAANKVCQ